MKIGNQASLFIAVLVLSALHANAADDVAKGRELAQRLCATCHMAPGQGEKNSRAEIPGFYAIARRPNQTEQGIVEWLRSVPPMMPNHHLSQDEMISLSQFIMSLRDEPPS
ncbi:MAG: c-type cytochrome [Hyphomicrobium sp.]|nr:c-type cytochrome [Hyphomicrobium sp.]